MNKPILHILLLEDDPLDVELNKNQIQQLEEFECIVTWVSDRKSYLKELDNCPDVILSDYSLPQYNGLEALNDLKKRNLLIPFVFVTGTINEETAAETIKAGAWEYVVKDRLFRLPLAIRSVLKLREERINTYKAEELNRKLSMAVEQSPVHIIIINIKGKIEYVNARFTEVTGYLPYEVIGKDPRTFIPGCYTDENLGNNWDFLTSGQSWRGEIQTQKKDGTPYWEYNTISPLKDMNGQITHFVIVKEDVTQRKAMEHELIDALDRAGRSDKLKEVFLQNLSHEIRTPLNAIVGFSNLLNEKHIDREEQKEFKSIILKSSQQLLSIVTDILTVSRIQTGQEQTIVRVCEVNEMFDNLKMMFLGKTQAKKLNFIVKKDLPNSATSILTDETKLIQILTNLLNNAIKFSHEGTIELGYFINGNTLNIYVKDAGIGIAEDSLEIIFERFRQADTSISSNYGGTGLGLSISKAYAEMLGGVITVKSKLGQGSTFTLSIPYDKAEIVVKQPSAPKVKISGQDITILVAEDEEYNFQLIEAYLSGQGFKIIHAKNGKEAIELYTKKPDISLILMDIKMPEINGQMAMLEIRKLNNSLPIIAQTAYALEHEKQQFLACGFNDYIAKPIKKETLLEMIYHHLHEYQV